MKSSPDISSDRYKCTHNIGPYAGAGLKREHGPEILQTAPAVGFFEIHAENYMRDGGPPHALLGDIRDRYPLSLHGVGLSIGGENPLDQDHLEKLKRVHDRYEPGLFSEHLAWSTHDNIYLNDLLPVAYNDKTLSRIADHIDEVQEKIGRQMLLENPSAYIEMRDSTYQETDFLREIAERTGCGLLLDVNNIFVSATNLQMDAYKYVDCFPLNFVQEIHLGGHAPDEDEHGQNMLIDAHDRPVDLKVWELYAAILAKTGPLPTLIEWDNNVPEWDKLYDEIKRADHYLSAIKMQHSQSS